MVKYEKKEHTIIKETPVKVICDICWKEVDPNNWFRITTSHHDWGNDSIDSYEQFDACSHKCAISFVNDYLREAYENEYNTKDIEIEHMRSIQGL